MRKIKLKNPTALILAGIMAVGAAIGVMGATLTATPVAWTATTPEGAPTNENYMVDLAGKKDSKGGKLTLTTPNANSWGSSHVSIARVTGVEGNTATYTAQKPGVFVAYRTTTIGNLNANDAMVYDSSKPYTYSITKNYSEIKAKDKTDTIPLTMKDMNNKTITGAVTWTSDDSSVATVGAQSGEITATADSGVANIIGRFTDCYGQTQKIHYSVVVGKVIVNEVVGPDGNGDYWKPVGKPKDVWEKTDEDGNPTEPPEYIYTPGGDPISGPEIIPVEKGDDGQYYVEDPTNIWTPVKDDGTLDEGNKIWGGDDKKPGTEDDGDVIDLGTKTTPDYWVSFGENVYAQISKSTGKIGALKGGGQDEDPTTDAVTPIFDNTKIDGHYYYGPHTDSDSITYYIGDDWMAGGKGDGLINTESVSTPASTDKIYYQNGDGTMTTTRPSTDVPATGIVLGDPASDTIEVGEKQTAPGVTVVPNDATNQTVEWSSSDTGKATVDASTGEVTGVSPGEVTITATITNSDGTKATGSYPLTIKETDLWEDVGTEAGNTFTASGVEWVILTVDDNGNALITTKDLQGTSVFNSTDGNQYAASTLRIAMEDFYDGLSEYDASSKEKKETGVRYITDVAQRSNFLSMTPAYDAAGGISAVAATGKKTCFALSYQEATAYLKDKTWAKAGQKDAAASVYWLRSPNPNYLNTSIHATVVHTSGALDNYHNVINSYGVRPALWISLF